MQALEAPVLKLAVVAAGALVLGAFAPKTHHRETHRLVLHAPVREHAIYLSAWMDGDPEIAFDSNELQPIRFEMRAEVSDGCRWLGIETLTPTEGHKFAYTYDEQILSCEPDSTPAMKTPRTGFVTIE